MPVTIWLWEATIRLRQNMKQYRMNRASWSAGRGAENVAGNVIHLLDEPLKAVAELDRVCRPGGTLIIPTYMNKDRKGRTSGFASAVGKAGADFKRQFTADSYRQFFVEAGY